MKRKFRPGKPIRSIGDLTRRLQRGDWVYMFGRPKHPGWILSMQFNSILYMLNSGFLYAAIRNKEAL